MGSGAATTPFKQIIGADCLLVAGSNTTEAHPIVGLKVREAVKRGARLIVMDPRRTELAALAEETGGIWLPLRPGTNIPVLNAMLHTIFDEGLENRGFIEARTEGVEAVRRHVADYSPEMASEIAGVSPEAIRQAARLYAGAECSLILYGLGIAEHRGGTLGVMALANLALATGHVGRPHTGINPLRGQNNVQGACDMGTLPYVYPGYQHADDPEVLERFAKAWGVSELPSGGGLLEPQMYEEARAGRLKAMYIVGYDPAQTQGNTGPVMEALRRLELLVVQDLFPTKTAEFAHVILPAACFYEKDGTFTSGERRVRRIHKVLDPPGDALADWEIVQRLSRALGHPMDYSHPSEIMDEIAALTPQYRGITYRVLGPEGKVWPAKDPEAPGEELLHTKSFPIGKGRFQPVHFLPPEEDADKEYPFVLITGRRLVHYNNGSMTRRAAGFDLVMSEEALEMNPEDARRLGLEDGERVRVESRRGAVDARLMVSGRVLPGTVFMSFHFDTTLTNLLTSPGLDPKTLTPEYKVSAVRVSRRARGE